MVEMNFLLEEKNKKNSQKYYAGYLEVDIVTDFIIGA